MSRHVELLRPQLFAVARIESAKAGINGRGDKNEIARGRDASAEAWCSGFDPFGFQFFEDPEWHMPSDIASTCIHGDEFSPRRRVARILRLRIPEPSALRCYFSIRVRVCVIGCGRRAVVAPAAAPAAASSAATAFTLLIGIDLLHVAPLAGIHD